MKVKENKSCTFPVARGEGLTTVSERVGLVGLSKSWASFLLYDPDPSDRCRWCLDMFNPCIHAIVINRHSSTKGTWSTRCNLRALSSFTAEAV